MSDQKTEADDTAISTATRAAPESIDQSRSDGVDSDGPEETRIYPTTRVS